MEGGPIAGVVRGAVGQGGRGGGHAAVQEAGGGGTGGAGRERCREGGCGGRSGDAVMRPHRGLVGTCRRSEQLQALGGGAVKLMGGAWKRKRGSLRRGEVGVSSDWSAK